MGIVASARHIELQQRVAIKVLPAHLTPDADLVERFMREARAAARLRSEHAVKVVDVGARSNGSPYIVMELLDGEDLGALSERGPLPIPVAVATSSRPAKRSQRRTRWGSSIAISSRGTCS